MEHPILIVGLVVAILLFLPARIFPDNPNFLKYKLHLQALVILDLLIILSLHFYWKGMPMAIIPVILGGIAFAKYFYDTSKQNK